MKTVEELLRELAGSAATAAEILTAASVWPPDVFALTSALLQDSGAYRRVVSPPAGSTWPPGRAEDWDSRTKAEAEGWVNWVVRRLPGGDASPSPIFDRCNRIALNAGLAVAELGSLGCWDVLTDVLTLQAIADSACADLGLAQDATSIPVEYVVEAATLLALRGTLSHLPADRVRVLPKTRTAQVGITARSLSHHLALCRSEVDVKWIRTTYPAEVDRLLRLRLLLFPWPFEIRAAAFSPAPTHLTNMQIEKFGFFDFSPHYDAADMLARFDAALDTATKEADPVDAVVLPESAVSAPEFELLWSCCVKRGVHVLLSGVRSPSRNQAWLRTGLREPQTYVQDKHHRWCLDPSQITGYQLGDRLAPSRRWWESMDVEQRSLTFVAFNDWLTLCHLICEDLARIDPVSQLVRSVGPTLVIALLLDGPQILTRWPARYASILADDPGSSVLTLTALGMALRSRTTEHPEPNATIALWKDSRPAAVPIEIAPTSDAVVLTLWADRLEEFTADGRTDGGMAGRLILGGSTQIPGKGWSDPLTAERAGL